MFSRKLTEDAPATGASSTGMIGGVTEADPVARTVGALVAGVAVVEGDQQARRRIAGVVVGDVPQHVVDHVPGRGQSRRVAELDGQGAAAVGEAGEGGAEGLQLVAA